MRSSCRRLPVLAPLLLAACSFDAPKQYLVTDLRILAVRAQVLDTAGNPTDVADPQIGQTVRLEALVANPRGRPVTLSWYTCNPQTPAEPLPPCFDEAWLRNPAGFATPRPGVYALGSFPVTGPTSSVDLATTDPRFQYPAAVTAVLAAKLVASEARPDCELYAPMQIVIAATADGITEVALKRIRVLPSSTVPPPVPGSQDAYLLNVNPTVGAIRANPTDADACLGGVVIDASCTTSTDCGGGACAPDGLCAPPPAPRTLCARAASVGLQSPYLCPAGAAPYPVPEELEWQWYVTAGKITNTGFNGNAVGDRIDLDPAGGTFTLWTILRDGRGGTDWFTRPLGG